MKAYCFDPLVAKVFGVEEAVMLWNLDFWIQKNKANQKHFHDGRYWTYNSTKAFSELFPFWSVGQVRRILRKLEEFGVIITGNYNSSAVDRTMWYAIDYSVLENALDETDTCICRNRQMDLQETENAVAESGKPIPDIIANINPDSNQIEVTREARKPSKSSNSLTTFDNSVIATWEKFSEIFGTDEYAGADIRYYYDTIKDWAAAKGARYKDWIAFVRNWMRRDFKEGKLVKQKTAAGALEPWQYKEILRQRMNDDDSLWSTD